MVVVFVDCRYRVLLSDRCARLTSFGCELLVQANTIDDM
jgi:hypothetical protein